MKKAISIVLLVLMMFTVVPSFADVSAASGAYMDVTLDDAPVRTEPKKSAKKVKGLAYGTTIYVTDSLVNSAGNLWYKTSGGYIFSGNLKSHTLHSYYNYISKAPTCQETGVRTYVCNGCGYTRTETVYQVGHSYGSNFMCTYGCGTCNPSSFSTQTIFSSYCRLYVKKDATSHAGPYGACRTTASYSKGVMLTAERTVVNGYGNTWYKLDNGSYIWSDYVTVHNDHTWDAGTVTKAPTCQETGVKSYTCTVCGQHMISPLSKVGHNYGSNFMCTYGCGNCNPSSITVKANVCSKLYVKADASVHSGPYGACQTTGSYKKGALLTSVLTVTNGHGHVWYKLDNGSYIWSDYITIHNSHTWDGGKVTKSPTCQATGVKTYTCTLCGQTKTESVAKVGHSYGSDYMCVYGCGTCNPSSIHTQSNASNTLCVHTASAIAHSGPYGACGTSASYNKGALLTAVATVTNGYGHTWYRLSNGSYIWSDYVTIHNWHTWNGGQVTQTPTCQQTGVKTYTCTLCGQTKTEAIAKTAHRYSSTTGKCIDCGTPDPSVKTLTAVSVATAPSRLTYETGDRLSTAGLTLRATYSDGSTGQITGGFTCTPTALNTAGTQKITVTYQNKSTSFNVTVKSPIQITKQPVNASGAVNGKVTYSVKANGSGLKYQWYYKKADASSWTAWKKGTSATLSVPVYNSWNGAKFYCKITASSGKTLNSGSAKLNVIPIQITKQPVNASGAVNGKVTYSVKANGSGLKYQWYYKKADASSWTAWKKGTSATLSVPVYNSWNGAKFYCKITASNGKVLNSGSAKLNVIPIQITKQPVNASGAVNGKVTYSVKANGSGLKYQWYYKKADASSWTAWKKGTSTTLSVPVYNSWNGAKFYCKITASNGKTLNSGSAKLNVIPIQITKQPVNASGAVNGKVTYSVKANGSGLKYQWYYKKSGASSWTAWKNGTSATLSVPVYNSWNGAKFYCKITASDGKTLNSGSAKLTVK